MCNAYCCCRETTTSGLINLLFVFAFINLLLSVISIFIRAAKTERYDQALLYLEAINNGELDLSLDIFGFNNCERTGDFLDNYYYCKINGKRLKQPSESISYQGLFKKWNKVELILSISRTAVTFIFLIFLFFVIKRKSEDLDINDETKVKNYENYLNYLIVFTVVLIVISGLWILIRALALSCNINIGLYEDGEQNAFEDKIAVNYIMDIIQIVLYGIMICFIIRIRRGLYLKPIPPPQIENRPVIVVQQPPTIRPVFVVQRPQPPPQPQIEIRHIQIERRKIILEPMNSANHPLDGFNY